MSITKISALTQSFSAPLLFNVARLLREINSDYIAEALLTATPCFKTTNTNATPVQLRENRGSCVNDPLRRACIAASTTTRDAEQDTQSSQGRPK